MTIDQSQKKLEKFLQKAQEKKVDISRIKNCLNSQWFQENYTTAEKTKLILICPIHGEYQQTISQFLKGKGCRKCSNIENARKNRKRNGGFHKKPSFKDFQKKISEINKEFNVEYELGFNEQEFKEIYENNKTKLNFICKTHGIFELNWRQLQAQNLCKECSISKKYLSYEKFLNRYKKYFRRDEFNYSLITKEWFNKERQNFDGPSHLIKIPIIHKDCNQIFYQTIGNHFLNDQGCPYCNPARKLELKDIKEIAKEFILESKKINQDIKIITKLNETWIKNYEGYSKTKLTFKCSKHNIFSKNLGDIKNLKQYGCPICNTEFRQSKGERKIEEILNQLNIEFKKEMKVFDTRLRFDFYLSKYNLAIEYDGAQHLHNLNFRGRNLRKIKKRDFLKNKLCHVYKINLIRIPYYEFNNLEEYLIKILKREKILKESE